MARSSNCNCLFDLLNVPCRNLFDYSLIEFEKNFAVSGISEKIDRRILLYSVRATRFLADQMRDSYLDSISREMKDPSTINVVSSSIKNIFKKVDGFIERLSDGRRKKVDKIYMYAHKCVIIRATLALGVNVNRLLEEINNHKVEPTHLWPGLGYGGSIRSPDRANRFLVINIQTKQHEWSNFLDIMCPILDPKAALRKSMRRMDGYIDLNEDEVNIGGHNFTKVYLRNTEELVKAKPINAIERVVSDAEVSDNQIQDVKIKVEV